MSFMWWDPNFEMLYVQLSGLKVLTNSCSGRVCHEYFMAAHLLTSSLVVRNQAVYFGN